MTGGKAWRDQFVKVIIPIPVDQTKCLLFTISLNLRRNRRNRGEKERNLLLGSRRYDIMQILEGNIAGKENIFQTKESIN